jgi:hypothetical protein
VERGPNAKRVILVITDGDDTSSSVWLPDVSERVERSNIVLYALDVRRDSQPGDRARSDLVRLSRRKPVDWRCFHAETTRSPRWSIGSRWSCTRSMLLLPRLHPHSSAERPL